MSGLDERPDGTKPEPSSTPAPAEATPSDRSPRLREPSHHRVVRPDAATRRKAITVAGFLLLAASGLGAYTAVGVMGQIGANPPAAIPDTPMPIQGSITDLSSHRLLEGVAVRILDRDNENVSNGDGWYYLAAVPPGTYTLEASKAGYTTLRKTINVSPGIPRVVDFAMPPGNDTFTLEPEPLPHFTDPTVGVFALGVAILVSSALAAAGGWSAVTHRHYLLAVAGAAGGTATVGLVFGLPLGSLLAAAALAILGSLKTGFLEAQSHRIPWESRSPLNRRGRSRSR